MTNVEEADIGHVTFQVYEEEIGTTSGKGVNSTYFRNGPDQDRLPDYTEAVQNLLVDSTRSNDESVPPPPPIDSEAPRVSEPGAPPPSYESLFGRVKVLKKESTSLCDFITTVFVYFLGSVCLIIILGICLALPIAMLYFGGKYLHECVAAMIPGCLLAGGILGVLRIVTCIGGLLLTGGDGDGGACCFPTLDAGLAVYFVVGSILVYIDRDYSTDPDNMTFCHPTLYNFAFWLFTSFYIVLGTCCCCGCLVFLCCSEDDDSKPSEVEMTQAREEGASADVQMNQARIEAREDLGRRIS